MHVKRLSSCGGFQPQLMREANENMTKRSEKLMIFEGLKENHTKVVYSRKKFDSVHGAKNEFQTIQNEVNIKRIVFKTCLLVGGFMFFGDIAFAESLDEKAKQIYFEKFLGIAKWIIIGKGGWDIVSKALKEDFDGAKRSVIQYIVVFATLLGLPWMLNQIEDIFKEES